MQLGPPRRRHARPVGDAPIDPLLAATEDLAKGWLLALLEQVPLDDAPGILAADLARDGPRVCEAAVRALASDMDLRSLSSGGALEPLVSAVGRMAGAHDALGTLRAIDALQAVIWSALREALPRPVGDQLAELAERLALVSECIRQAALRGTVSAPVSGVPASAVSEPLPGGSAGGAVEASDGPPAALWMGALDEEIEQSARTGKPLSLLLVELEDSDRLLAVERLERAGATFGRFAHAVRGVLRRRDLLARETDARAWIIARETGRPSAQALGERIAEAVAETELWRGAPLSVTVGVAVLGADGEDREALVEAAEEDRFAAAARGVSILAFDGEGGDESGA
jgi:GGDEF domain-containing protein